LYWGLKGKYVGAGDSEGTEVEVYIRRLVNLQREPKIAHRELKDDFKLV
jgi:hypothetical protein